ncbi:hypothetical protein B1218_34235 [Pseudomonas ogarae]|nr:hypothetical protein B1218_34235 [Pseudomonas ogarae]
MGGGEDEVERNEAEREGDGSERGRETEGGERAGRGEWAQRRGMRAPGRGGGGPGGRGAQGGGGELSSKERCKGLEGGESGNNRLLWVNGMRGGRSRSERAGVRARDSK